MGEENKTTSIPLHLKHFFEKVDERRGKVSTVLYKKELEPKKIFVKKFGEIGNIVNESIFQVRAGIDYENIQTVKEKHESGEVQRRGLPPSMERIDRGVYYNKNTDKWMIGCQPSKNKNSIHKSRFLLDNVEIELDDIVVEDKTLRDALYARDLKSKEDSEWINLDVTKIKKFSGV